MKRTKAQPIGALLENLFNSPDVARKIAEGSLPHIWREVTGEVVAANTRQVRFVRGTLYVHVTSSILRSVVVIVFGLPEELRRVSVHLAGDQAAHP